MTVVYLSGEDIYGERMNGVTPTPQWADWFLFAEPCLLSTTFFFLCKQWLNAPPQPSRIGWACVP